MDKPNKFERAVSRVAGFFAGIIFGLIFAIIAIVLLSQVASVDSAYAFLGVIVSVIVFALFGTIWPKWFTWIFEIFFIWD